jgi:2-dehydropantoate 2-reductase
MNIAIIGAGAMGSMIGAYLQKGGANVVLVSQPHKDHTEKIKANGLTIRSKDKTEIIPINTATSYDNLGIMDYVIILVKATATKQLLTEIQPIIGVNTYVCTLQNGIGNEEIIEEVINREKILYGCLNMSSVIYKPGEVYGELFKGMNIYIGSVSRNKKQRVAGNLLAEIFNKAGVRAAYDEDNIDLKIWNKLMMNIVINAPLGLVRLKVGNGVGDSYFKELSQHFIEETVKVAKAKNITGLDASHFLKEIIPSVAKTAKNHYPSMAQDMMMSKRKTEIDTLNGAIVRLGKRYGIPTPYNDAITLLVKLYESHYSQQYES